MKGWVILAFIFINVFGSTEQDSCLRLPHEPATENDGKFPYEEYHHVSSWSLNRKGRAELEQKYIDQMAWFKNHPEENDPDKIKELGRLAEEFSLGERSLILEGKMARTAEKIKDLTSDDIQAINSILKEYRNNNDPSPNCMPFYRDGLIFYGEDGQVVSYINICFQCGFIDTNPRYAFIYNSDQLRRLKFFFREGLGHPVE